MLLISGFQYGTAQLNDRNNETGRVLILRGPLFFLRQDQSWLSFLTWCAKCAAEIPAAAFWEILRCIEVMFVAFVLTWGLKKIHFVSKIL